MEKIEFGDMVYQGEIKNENKHGYGITTWVRGKLEG